MKWLLLALLVPAGALALENDYVRVSRNEATCAAAGIPGCGSRVVVALHDLALRSQGGRRELVRGDVAVFAADESFETPAGAEFFEVVIKPDHPPALAPAQRIAPEKNTLRHDGEDFFVFHEQLEPGDTRPRHSHSQRVVIQLNRTRLHQWPDGDPERIAETVPERPVFSPPVVHVVKNIGDVPLFGVIIEFKPRAR